MKDKLHSISSNRAQVSAFKLLDSLQRLPTEEQAGSLILAFLLMCKRFDYPPREACELGERLLSDCFSKSRGEPIRALENYLKGEL